MSINNNDEIRLIDFWNILVIQKKIIISLTLISLIIGLIYSFVSTPYYESKIILVPSEQQSSGALTGSFSGIAAIAGVNVGNDKTDTYLQILQSRDFLNAYLEEEDYLPILFKGQWDKKNKKWIANEPPSQGNIYGLIKSLIEISRNKDLIIVKVTWEDPLVVSNLANELINGVNTRIRNQAIEESEKSVAFLEAESNKTVIVSTKNAIYNLIEEQMKTIMLANVRDEFAFKVIDKAHIPEHPSNMSTIEITILSSMIGFLLGIMFGVINHTFLNIKD